MRKLNVIGIVVATRFVIMGCEVVIDFVFTTFNFDFIYMVREIYILCITTLQTKLLGHLEFEALKTLRMVIPKRQSLRRKIT